MLKPILIRYLQLHDLLILNVGILFWDAQKIFGFVYSHLIL